MIASGDVGGRAMALTNKDPLSTRYIIGRQGEETGKNDVQLPTSESSRLFFRKPPTAGSSQPASSAISFTLLLVTQHFDPDKHQISISPSITWIGHFEPHQHRYVMASHHDGLLAMMHIYTFRPSIIQGIPLC